MVVFAIAFKLSGRMVKPLFAHAFHEPSLKQIDLRLVGGALLFGIGWGLVGLCPGLRWWIFLAAIPMCCSLLRLCWWVIAAHYAIGPAGREASVLEQQRLDYLQTMGVVQWLARKPLPYAPPSRYLAQGAEPDAAPAPAGNFNRAAGRHCARARERDGEGKRRQTLRKTLGKQPKPCACCYSRAYRSCRFNPA